MTEVEMMKNMSEDVILKIQSFLLGRPEELRLKHKKKFVELQRLFKITYTPFRFIDTPNSVHSSYWIEGKMLNLDILLKQGERLGRAWEETYERLIENKTFKSRPSHFCMTTELLVWVKTEKDLFENDFYINDGDDFDVDEFLQDTKAKFANEMRLNDAKSIISFILFVCLHF